MISCPKCGKENQDHYKFCLGCGNELPRDVGGGRAVRPTPNAVPLNNPEAARRPPAPATPMPNSAFASPPVAPIGAAPPFAPVQPPVAQPFVPVQPPVAAPFVPVQPPIAAPPVVAAPVVAAPVVAAPVAAPVAQPTGFPSSCPQCSSPNPRNNRFCITCGFDMSTALQPPAPPPPPPPPPPPAPEAFVQAPVVVAQPPSIVQPPSIAQQPAQPAFVEKTKEVPQRAAPTERARLVLIRPDGTEGGTSSLTDGTNTIGRDAGGLFASDMYLSPKHATITIQGSQITVEDKDSLNGVYLRIERQVPVEIRDGDIFRIGQEILQYRAFGTPALEADGTEQIGAQVEGLIGKVSLVVGRDGFGNAFPIPITGLYLGRERGDILFPEDGYVSGLHCQLNVTGNQLTLTDVGSSNGTYLRIHGPRSLQNGDFLLMGQQLFRLGLI